MVAFETAVRISKILWKNRGKDELKMKKEKTGNRENSGDVIQKLCEAGDTSSNEKLWEDLEESREKNNIVRWKPTILWSRQEFHYMDRETDVKELNSELEQCN